MVKFFPERADISLMKPPPTEGEQFLLDFLAEYLGKLDGEFEVFFQAHWDGSFPDVVVMRKNHGILIIEVKDWNLSSYKLEDANTWIVNSSGQRIKSPIAQVKYYKDLFYDTYSRTLAEENLRDSKAYSLVQAAVFFYGATTEQVKNFFGILGADGHSLKYNYILLLTRDQLERDALRNFNELNFLLGAGESKYFKDDVYDELCRVLKPSDHSLTKIFFPESLSPAQKRLAQCAAGSGKKYIRQLRAPAGSGKTTVLAFRAVDAYRKTNAPVLILTFNITLCNYIRDCLSQALNSLPNIQGRKSFIMKNYFSVVHFHKCIRDYRAKHDQFDIVKTDETGREVDTYELTATPQKFQTIFVDETQDFERYWMETIVRLLAPTGELVFFGDWDQDIYEVRQKDAVPTGRAGVLRLNDGSYRLRSKIFNLAHEFQAKFLPNSDNKLTAAKTRSKPATLFADDAGDSTTVQYHYFDSFDAEAIVDIFADALKKFAPPNDDICILSQVIKNVRPVDKILRDKGHKTITTFEHEEDWQDYHDTANAWKIDKIRQAAKYNFRMESGKFKLATIHSYKGWGIHTAILIIGNDNSVNAEKKFLNAEMVYTGITRAKKNLIVINIGDSDYDEFFHMATEDKVTLSKQKIDEAFELFKQRDFDGAIELADEAIQLNPNYAAAYNSRGGFYYFLKQYERAIQDFDKSIALNPKLAGAYYNRGAAYKNLGEYHKAIADFQKYAELNPTDAATAYKKLGECYQMLATR